MIVAISSATFLFFLHDLADGSDNLSVNNNCGEIGRRDAREVLREISENDSDFQNLTKGNYATPVAIFNETGESVGYIQINGWYIYEATVKMQNGTLKSIEAEGTLEDIYREADSLNGSVISTHGQITGGEFYMVTIDTPNETVKSIEKVNELPEWGVVDEVWVADEAADKEADNEKIILKLIERTGYSREELFGPVNPFGNNTTRNRSI